MMSEKSGFNYGNIIVVVVALIVVYFIYQMYKGVSGVVGAVGGAVSGAGDVLSSQYGQPGYNPFSHEVFSDTIGSWWDAFMNKFNKNYTVIPKSDVPYMWSGGAKAKAIAAGASVVVVASPSQQFTGQAVKKTYIQPGLPPTGVYTAPGPIVNYPKANPVGFNFIPLPPLKNPYKKPGGM